MGIRIVIAGESQCNFFAEICLVADYLSQNLPIFSYESIEKPVAEWKTWLFKLNQKNKWHHIESPVVWKELLMTGSAPIYIGGASEFLEYIHSYYQFDVFIAPKRFDHLVDYSDQFQKKIKQEVQTEKKYSNSEYFERIEKTSYTVCISGAGNPLAMFLISGLLETFGKIRFSKIYLYDEVCSQRLMDFIENECNYIESDYSGKIVKYTEKIGVALTNSDLLILLNYVPFRSTYSIGDWLYKNKKLMESMAVKINATASQNMYIILPNLGPACYNATILANSLNKIDKNNIVVVTSDLGLDILPVAAEIAEVPLRNLFCPPVWGFVGINHLADIQTTFHKYNSFDPYDRHTKVRSSTLCIGTLTPEIRTMEYLMFFDERLWKTVADRKPLECRRNAVLTNVAKPLILAIEKPTLKDLNQDRETFNTFSQNHYSKDGQSIIRYLAKVDRKSEQIALRNDNLAAIRQAGDRGFHPAGKGALVHVTRWNVLIFF
ncbi:jg2182 [Pararge aegeria aegeria]|uniref:Jg2182 protein n=1 Tax=Pararge aegeria aegeria TaxID=348720 RepID=A0A8S4RX54_9NEOP|nr:jg2182 [Pararge aegeria aegeria]